MPQNATWRYDAMMTDGASFDDLIAAANSRDGGGFRAAISSLGTDQVTRLLLEIVKHQWALIDMTTSLSLGDVEYVYRIVELLLSGPSRADAAIIEQWRYVDEAAADRKREQLRAQGRTAAKQIGHLRWLSEDEADTLGRAIEKQTAGQKPTSGGFALTGELLDRLVEEAEEGYEPDQLRPRAVPQRVCEDCQLPEHRATRENCPNGAGSAQCLATRLM